MSAWVKKSLYSIGALLLALVVVGVFLPSSGHVERATVIDAPPATLFAVLDDLRRVPDWSPWIENDPHAQLDYSSPTSGTGGALRWDGIRLGAGGQTIVESVPNRRLVMQLDLGHGQPIRSEFELSATASGTQLRWICKTEFGINLFDRYSGLFLESAIGRDLERGLANIQTLAESLPRADWSDIGVERLVVAPVEIAYLTARSLPTAEAISEAVGQAYFNILAYMGQHGLQEAGPPISISRRFSGAEFVFDAAIPVRGVSDDTPRTANGIRLGTSYGGPAIRGRHIGSYGNLRQTHEKMAAYLAAHGIARAGDAWEAYVSDPTRTPESERVTDVYYPIGEPD
jgi:uncharacterized protein YndB with AHSA1/START domain